MAKTIFHLVISTCRVFGKSISRTIREEIEESQRAAEKIKQMQRSEMAVNKGSLSVEEACMILNLTKDKFTEKEIEARFDHLFKINEKLSFYLQSKVFRARETLMKEIESKNIKD